MYLLAVALALVISLYGCQEKDKDRSLGDTNSVTGGGGPPVKDTTTINKERQDSAAKPMKDSTSKGNVNPTGHINPKNQK